MGPLSTGPTPGLGKRRPVTSGWDPSSANRPSSSAETAPTIRPSASWVKFRIVELRCYQGRWVVVTDTACGATRLIDAAKGAKGTLLAGSAADLSGWHHLAP